MIVGCSAGPTKFYTKEQDPDLTIDVNMDILWRLNQDEALTSMPKVIFLDFLRSPTTICGFRTEMEPGFLNFLLNVTIFLEVQFGHC